MTDTEKDHFEYTTSLQTQQEVEYNDASKYLRELILAKAPAEDIVTAHADLKAKFDALRLALQLESQHTQTRGLSTSAEAASRLAVTGAVSAVEQLTTSNQTRKTEPTMLGTRRTNTSQQVSVSLRPTEQAKKSNISPKTQAEMARLAELEEVASSMHSVTESTQTNGIPVEGWGNAAIDTISLVKDVFYGKIDATEARSRLLSESPQQWAKIKQALSEIASETEDSTKTNDKEWTDRFFAAQLFWAGKGTFKYNLQEIARPEKKKERPYGY